MKRDYYEILGIPHNASKEDIKRAYYILAHQYHPDKNYGNEEKFKEINEAYRVLTGSNSKSEYDRSYNSNNSENYRKEEGSNNRLKSVYKKVTCWVRYTLLFIILFLFILGLIESITTKEQTTGNQAADHESDVVMNTTTPNNSNEKCVIEDKGLKICDLSYSDSPYNSEYRNISVRGNTVACINMNTGEVTENDVGKLRVSTATAFCVTDWGNVYIDPIIQVAKRYGKITQEGYGKPYKVSRQYDTCIWTYDDGNATIPHLEVLSNIGPRTGYNTKAFCVNDTNQVDIYSASLTR